jgi:hypothetical protein
MEHMAAVIAHRHGSPEAAIVSSACVRMHERAIAYVETLTDWLRIDVDGLRSGRRNAVRIELLELVRYQIPQPQRWCPRSHDVGRCRGAHQRWRSCDVCAGGDDPAFPAPSVRAKASIPDGHQGRLRHIACEPCLGLGCLVVPSAGGL